MQSTAQGLHRPPSKRHALQRAAWPGNGSHAQRLAGLQGSAIGAHPATCQWQQPLPGHHQGDRHPCHGQRGGFCPRLCAALLGFRRRACLRMPCDAIWCEFWVCDEMGSLSSSRLDAPTGCEVRFCLANAKLSLLGSFGFLAHTRSLRTTL